MSKKTPDLPGFREFYGIKVSSVGDDGDLVALGHHPPKATLAAFNAYAKEVYGLIDLLDGPETGHRWQSALNSITATWAYLITKCDSAEEPDHPDDCSECQWIDEASWVISCDGRPEAAETFPVMTYQA